MTQIYFYITLFTDQSSNAQNGSCQSSKISEIGFGIAVALLFLALITIACLFRYLYITLDKMLSQVC